jgi:hypothetical protein
VDAEQHLGGRRELGARVERHGCQVEVDLVEDVGQRVDRHTPLAGHQPQRGDAVLQVGEHRAPGHVGVRVGVALADVPAGGDHAVGPSATHERRQPGHSGIGHGVVRGVERPDVEPVVGGAGQGVLHRTGRLDP